MATEARPPLSSDPVDNVGEASQDALDTGATSHLQHFVAVCTLVGKGAQTHGPAVRPFFSTIDVDVRVRGEECPEGARCLEIPSAGKPDNTKLGVLGVRSLVV